MTQQPAAAQQMRRLRTIADQRGASLRILGWDYARTIGGRKDLPDLFKLLAGCRVQALRDGRRPRIVVDDYSRLFRVTELDARDDLWTALTDHSDYLIDLRQGKPLHALSREMALLIKMGALPPYKDRGAVDKSPHSKRATQTEKARIVSAVVRGKAADHAAQALIQALQEHSKRHPAVTVKAFLETEEGKGLRNSQGRPWSYRSALRVLREHGAPADRKDHTGSAP